MKSSISIKPWRSEAPARRDYRRAKISTKLDALKNIVSKVDYIIIGGMAFTFLKAKGLNVGKSLLEAELVNSAKEIMDEAAKKGVEILLPVDIVAAPEFDNNSPRSVVPADKITDNLIGLDIGPESVKLFNKKIMSSKTVIWNGPMGASRCRISQPHQRGCEGPCRFKCLSIVGGGDSVSAVNQSGLADKYLHFHRRGAWLELLEGKTLPASQR